MTDAEAITWGEFSEVEPELARFGAEKLTALPAYLATVRRSGAPRVHPVTPIFTTNGLFLFMEPTSPKGVDLRDRKWFAIHSGVPDNAGTGGEFNASGVGLPITDAGCGPGSPTPPGTRRSSDTSSSSSS